MQNKFQYHKELRWLKLNEITILEDYRIYTPRERTDLELSIKDSGLHEPLTAVHETEKIILLNGFDRMDTLLKKEQPDLVVPVWVILDPLTDSQKKKLILDLARQKQKTYVDYMNEYHLYDSLIPNEQGKNMGGKNRHKLIALMIGISTSQLSKLLRIDKVSPSLLSAVDHEHLTLSAAEQRCKEIIRNGRERDPHNTHAELFNPDKSIDVSKALTHCPACNRPLTTIDFDGIQDLFIFKRDETNSQIDWKQPLTDKDIEELNGDNINN